MNKVKIILLIVAAALVLVGGGLITIALWRGVGNSSYRTMVEKTYDLPKGFQSVVIDCDDCDLRIERGKADAGSVYYKGDGRQTPKVEVVDGVLHIDSSVGRDTPWYERISLLSFGGDQMVVSLPGSNYNSLTIRHTSGDTRLEDGFVFGQVELRSASGDAELSGDMGQSLTIYSTSGRVSLHSVRCGLLTVESTSGSFDLTDAVVSGDVDVDHTSGSTTLENVTCSKLNIESQSGSIHLENVVAGRTFTVESTSGSIKLTACDADELDLKTTSGSIHGTLRTAKVFTAVATSGSVHVPNTTSGGICRARCTSGSIDLKIAD